MTSPLAFGRNVLITGATGGFGRSLVERFWGEGANLVLTGRSAGALAALAGQFAGGACQVCCVIAADLADPSAPAQIFQEARTAVSSLDVLVNNAAVQGPIGPAWDNDWIAWQRTLQVNLMAPVALCRLAVPWMRERAGTTRAKILNVSGGGATSARPGFSAYAAAKAALVRFSETLADETRALGIDVNCVAPGLMKTGMTEAVLSAGPEAAGTKEYEQAHRIAQTENGRSTCERAAKLCAFLASAASDGITGKLLSAVWDPWETLPEHRAELQQTDVYTLRRITPADRGLSWGDK